jgi:RNA polymerase sigma factor (sigma-70 family)
MTRTRMTLFQECLTRALSKLNLWHEGSNLRAWLFTILHNQHVNHVRRSIRAGALVEFDEAAPVMSQPASQEKRLELCDLDRALGQLPADQRAAILLIGLEGMPYAEIGAVLGIPVGTVRSRLSRGRRALRELMRVEPGQRSAITNREAIQSPTLRNPNWEVLRPDGRSADTSPQYPAITRSC